MSEALYKLVNPEFEFQLGEKVFKIRKASIEKVVRYQQRIKELVESADPAKDMKLVAFCVSVMLSDQDPSVTEEFVMSFMPASIDIPELLVTLGFMNPKKAESLKAEESQTTDKSSQPSPSEQDGGQETSAS